MKVFEKIRKPACLERGDTIGIVAPAWSFDPDKFKLGVDKLCRLGFRLKYSQSIFNKYWSMAGYDRKRAELINSMFADKKVKAILCAKAGYGSIRTLPYLDTKTIKKNPKIFVGYSDITILLSYIYKISKMVVFHGPVVSGEIQKGMNPMTLKYLLKAITQTRPLGRMKFSTMRTIRRGKARGILTGGNLSLLVNTIGTPYEINTENKILFLEDVGESFETIDNCLMHLKLAGKFRKIKGIIFGRMLGCADRSGRRYNIKSMINDILHDVDVPIIYGFPSGHRMPGEVNVTLPLGVFTVIDGTNAGLIIEEEGVS